MLCMGMYYNQITYFFSLPESGAASGPAQGCSHEKVSDGANVMDVYDGLFAR